VSYSGSVTEWIQQLKDGEEYALTLLYERYWPYLVGIARKKMSGGKRRSSDEEDIAQEAFLGFYRSLKDGRLPKMSSRNDLVSLLVIITARKAADNFKAQLRMKRGGGQVRGESVLEAMASSSQINRGIGNVAGSSRTPEEEAILNDCYQHYIEELPADLAEFARLYLAGLSYEEIGEQMDCVNRTVKRKVKRIKERWQRLASTEVETEIG
jgi:RNA polymerase sigma factor (sigma-70 family)